MKKEYLGDGVYAKVDNIISGDLILTVEDGGSTTNTIYLELEVWRMLLLYMERADASHQAN